jgi:alkaline phosphatase D
MLFTRFTAIVSGALVCLMGVGAQSLPRERTLVAHDFEASSHGWLVSGDTGAFQPRLHAAGGDPGGYISHADEAQGETWYFRAPDSVLTALAAAEHGTLSYSLKQSAELSGVLDDDVVIAGPAGRLSFRFRTSPGTGWTPFSVKLTAAAGWRWNWNAPASQEQIRSVLANPTSLEIRGEYHTGPDEGALDTVVLRAGG